MLFARSQAPSIPKYMKALLFFCGIIFLIEMADSIMSYVSPIYIEDNVKNSLYMGIIFASSSFVGLICDAVFPNLFRSKHHTFFLWNTVILALLFPAVFLFFPHAVPEFILAMAIWGVYYEFLVFSKAYFIEAFIKMDRHAMAWGVLNTFRSITMFISPIVVPVLLDRGVEQPLIATFTFLFLGMVGILVFHKLFPHKEREVVKEVVVKRTSALKELYVWRSLIRRIWPIFLFMFTLFILEATFFSVGILASEDLRQVSQWGTLLIPAYTLPNLFTGFFIQKLGIKLGKKRLAFSCGAIGGLLLFLATLLESNPLLLVIVIFLSACFSSISYPAILAAAQDYVTRLGEFGGEMVGLENASGSIGYIIGPIVAGWAGMQFGNIHAVGLIGLFLLAVSVLNLVIVPRKIHLPQKELQDIAST